MKILTMKRERKEGVEDGTEKGIIYCGSLLT